MTSRFKSFLIPTLCTLALNACNDDPKLVAQKAQQNAEISRLRGELAVLDLQLKNLPPDVSEELATAKKANIEAAAEAADLEKQVAALEARKSQLEAEFASYKAKYIVK